MGCTRLVCWTLYVVLHVSFCLTAVEAASGSGEQSELHVGAQAGSAQMSYRLPELGFPYDALKGSFVDAETMHLHHDKHHATYVAMLNKAVEEGGLDATQEVGELVSHLDQVPPSVRAMVRNHGGGHLNHLLFWKWLRPGAQEPQGALADKITQDFGSFKDFQATFEREALARFGAGWCWLVLDAGKLRVCSTANQDNPMMDADIGDCHGQPILGLDVWEHAYYLNYFNVRPAYVKAFWKVANWDQVSSLYASAVNKAKLKKSVRSSSIQSSSQAWLVLGLMAVLAYQYA